VLGEFREVFIRSLNRREKFVFNPLALSSKHLNKWEDRFSHVRRLRPQV